MGALGVTKIFAAPFCKSTGGLDGRAGSRRNGMAASASAQFCWAQDEERICSSAGSENVSAFEKARGQFRACSCSDGSKLALASLVSAGLASAQSALAVSYDDVVGAAQEAAASSGADSFGLPDVDTSSLTDFLSSNPLALLGGGAIVALPLLFATIFKQPDGYGTVSAKQAFSKLGDEELNGELLDIRVADATTKAEGKPDLKAYKKKVIQLPYTSEPEEYVSKVLRKFKDAENTTIFVLDRFDGDSLDVAKLLADGGFKAAYAIKDGAEGPSGWQTSELPWLVPQKFSLDLGGFKDLLSTSDTGNLLPTTLGVAAAAGVGLVVFSEAETALQLLGSAALVQLFVKKFLFAADRKKSLAELKTFLDTKVAPAEIVDELKEIADVLLPKYEEVEAAAVNGAALVENTVADVAEETAAKVETDTPALAVETASPAETIEEEQVEVDPTELPRTGGALSPYSQYEGLKPPSSPSPARP